MKIIDIRETWISIPRSEAAQMGRFGKIYANPYASERDNQKGTHGKGASQSKIIRIYTDEGLIGVSEREVAPPMVSVEQLKPSLLGCDPFDVEAIVDAQLSSQFASAPQEIAAVEIACWDLMGRKTGLPVYKLMGGAVRDKVFISRFIGIMPVDETVKKARAAVDAGIRTIKLKVGWDTERDLAAVRAVREAVGESVDIRVDANQSWSVPAAISIINRLERYAPQFIEQPIPWWDHGGLARVKGRTRVPLCLCEGWGYAVAGLPRLLDLIKDDAIDFLSTDPLRAGGLLGFKKLCALCEAAGIPVVMHWTRAGVSQAAWLQCCLTNRATMYANDIICSNIGPSPIDDIITRPFIHENGCLKAPTGPGLGIELDEAKLARYEVPRQSCYS